MPLRFRGRPIFPPIREVFVFPAPGWKNGSLLWRVVVVIRVAHAHLWSDGRCGGRLALSRHRRPPWSLRFIDRYKPLDFPALGSFRPNM